MNNVALGNASPEWIRPEFPGQNKTRRIHANRRIAFCWSIAPTRLTVQFNGGRQQETTAIISTSRNREQLPEHVRHARCRLNCASSKRRNERCTRPPHSHGNVSIHVDRDPL